MLILFTLVLFVAVPEPLYSGPDSVQLFSARSLEVYFQTEVSKSNCKNKKLTEF